MGYKADVSPGVTKLEESSHTPSLEIVLVIEVLIRLNIIIPGELENEINVKNLPNFEALNRAFPAPPPVCR